jgi:hypothetical protein
MDPAVAMIISGYIVAASSLSIFLTMALFSAVI